MSLARTALRLAAIAALDADPVVDALCEGRVYDSRIGPISSSEPVPVLTVFTEDATGEAYSANNGGAPFDERCEMLVEIAMASTVPDDEGAVALAESDRQLEAMIDLLEHRVVVAVTIGDTAASRLVRTTVTRRVTGFKSMRFVSEDTTLKLAVRMLHLSVQLKGDDQYDVRDTPTGPFASLPNPLRAVAESLDPESSGYATCQKLVAYGGLPAVSPFQGADMTLAPRPAVDPLAPPTPAPAGFGNFAIAARPASL